MILANCHLCEEEYPRLRANQKYCCSEHQVKANHARLTMRRRGLALLAAGLAVDIAEQRALTLRGWLLSGPRA